MPIPLPRQMHVLHNRNFRLYWLGQLVSLTGTWMQAVAQGWVVLLLTGSVAALGVVNFAVALPTLVLSLTGGVAADRWDRRRIMIATQAALMAIAFALWALLALDALTLWLLLAFAVLTGIASAYDMPAQQALVPDLVAPAQIPQAIALNQVIFNGSRLVGPAVAGIAIAKLGVASAYFFNGLSFVAVIASLLLIRVPAGKVTGGARGPMWQALREGLAYVARAPLLRALIGVAALSVLLIFPPLAVFSPGYVREVLHAGPGTVGALMAASGGASMVGAVAMLWIPAARRGQVMAAGVVAMALALVLLAVLHTVWAAMVATGLISLGFSLYMGLNATIIQQTVPGALRGRVMSVSGLSFSGMVPAGSLLGSVLVERLGFTAMYVGGAALYAAVALPLLLSSGVIGHVPVSEAAAPAPTPAGVPAGAASD
jgi:MFS family permease